VIRTLLHCRPPRPRLHLIVADVSDRSGSENSAKFVAIVEEIQLLRKSSVNPIADIPIPNSPDNNWIIPTCASLRRLTGGDQLMNDKSIIRRQNRASKIVECAGRHARTDSRPNPEKSPGAPLNIFDAHRLHHN
jgi:hypothetical protein